jgi:hypothetical protein
MIAEVRMKDGRRHVIFHVSAWNWHAKTRGGESMIWVETKLGRSEFLLSHVYEVEMY